ncbi:MAG: hypothetical protein WCW26_02695 [Candidatus Buchananbacteria bacterium]
MKVKNEHIGLVVLLAVLAALFLVYDLWLVFTRTIDGSHIPFLFPILLGAFAIVLYKHGRPANEPKSERDA